MNSYQKTGLGHIQLSNHQKDIIIEFAMKNGTECIYYMPILKITKTGESNYQIDITVEFTLKNRSWTYTIHPCGAIAIKIYSKWCECIISAIKGNRQETIVVHHCKQM